MNTASGVHRNKHVQNYASNLRVCENLFVCKHIVECLRQPQFADFVN